MPLMRSEQVELDELLSDIYLGIESLPDKSTKQSNTNRYQQISRGGNNQYYSFKSGQNQQAPTSATFVSEDSLRNQQEPQSLASIVNSTTTQRRVRIVEPPDKRSKQLDEQQVVSTSQPLQASSNNYKKNLVVANGANLRRPEVKYVNANKLIYHQEETSDEDDDDNNNNNNKRANNYRETSYYNQDHHLVTTGRNYNYPESEQIGKTASTTNNKINSNNTSVNNEDNYDDYDDDYDGKTRVKYYHTTWLDRQLGRVNKRRSSKELTEREIKEKALIDELKKNLKNGAITLRQSLKGKKSSNKNNKTLDSYNFDDNQLFGREKVTTYTTSSPYSLKRENKKVEYNSVIGSGLVTLPRNRNNQQQQVYKTTSNNYYSSNPKTLLSNDFSHQNHHQTLPLKQQATSLKSSIVTNTTQTSTNISSNNNNNNLEKKKPNQSTNMQTRQQEITYSRTLPHKRNQHQLLQAHYKGARNNFSNNTLSTNQSNQHHATGMPASSTLNRPTTNNINYPTNTTHRNPYNSNTIELTRISHAESKSPNPCQPQSAPLGETISSIPSATEVVRSALSRNSSSTDLNQLTKTMNLLPNSPSPCYHPSPMTPTQQLKPTSPSPLSPSPVSGSPFINKPYNNQLNPKLQQQQQQQQQQHHQPVYANPHTSLMQHRADEQARKQNRNQASIREFNELDTLLRSLSPNSVGTSTNVTPGYSSKPAQAGFGYGYSPAPTVQPQQQPQQPVHSGTRLTGQRVIPASQDVYAKVQKQPFTSSHTNNEQTKASYLQQNYLTQQNLMGMGGGGAGGKDDFIIDVTNNKLVDENCLAQQSKNQNLSEFEPPIELLPSMEDYQNISKLNPVKNHYWYKPHMSRDRAIDLLKDKPQGTFIVRDSTSFQGAFGLAVKVSRLPKNVLNNASLRNPNDPSAELIRHFLIEPTPGGVRLKGYANEPIFGSLPALIYQHSLVELALPCKLVIPRADIEDENFNVKQKQFYDEFLASKEIAKHSPYEIKSPDGGYRRYPGDVWVHNEHRIIYE